MAGHNEMRITVQVGNQVEGWKLDETIIEALFPRANTDSEKVVAAKELMRFGFRDELGRVVGVPAVDDYIAEHVETIS